MANTKIYFLRFCFISYLLLINFLTLRRSDLSLHKDEISKLLSGNYASLAVFAFILLAIGSILLGQQIKNEKAKFIRILIQAYGCCVLIAGITKPNQVIHDVVSLLAFISVPVAAYLFAKYFKQSYIAVVLIGISLIAWPLLGFGYSERFTVYIEVLWLLWLTFKSKLLFAGK